MPTAPNFDLDRAARVLVDACFMTDNKAAAKNGLSRQSIINYRRRLRPEHETFTPELVRLFTLKLEEARAVEGWADNLTATIRKAMSAVADACDEMDLRNPQALNAVTTALQVLIEAQIALDMLYGRYRLQDRSQNTTVPEGGFAGPTARA